MYNVFLLLLYKSIIARSPYFAYRYFFKFTRLMRVRVRNFSQWWTVKCIMNYRVRVRVRVYRWSGVGCIINTGNNNFQFVFKRFFSLLFHWLRCKVTSWWHVQSVVHVTTRLIWPDLTRSTTFVSNIRWMNRVRHGSLGVWTSTARAISCGSLLILSFLLKIDVRWLYVPPEGQNYNHV